MDTTIKENAKCKKILTQNIQEIQDTMIRPNLRIIGIEENEDSQLKGPVNIFNKIIGEGWRNDSLVKSTDCSSIGPEFRSQQPHGGSLSGVSKDSYSVLTFNK